MRNIKTFIFLMCTVALAPAQAGLLYSQAWDGTSDGLSSTYDTNTGNEVSYVLDTFSLDPSINHVKVDNIGWWGGYSQGFNPFPASFFIDIGDASTGNSLFSFTNSVTASATTNPLVSFYSMDLGSLNYLYGGMDYYILIQAEHDVTNQASASSWFWAYDTAATGNSELFYDNIDIAVPGPYFLNRDAAFVLNGTVPEPATIWLMLLALAGMIVVKRRSIVADSQLSA